VGECQEDKKVGGSRTVWTFQPPSTLVGFSRHVRSQTENVGRAGLSPATPPVTAKTERGSSAATKHAPAVAIIAAIGQGLQAQCQWGACPEVEACVGVEPGIIGARLCCVVLGRPDMSSRGISMLCKCAPGVFVLYFACVWFGHGFLHGKVLYMHAPWYQPRTAVYYSI